MLATSIALGAGTALVPAGAFAASPPTRMRQAATITWHNTLNRQAFGKLFGS